MVFYIILGASLLVYLALAWFAGGWLGLQAPKIWIFRGLLAALGLMGATVMLIWRMRQQKRKQLLQPSGAASAQASAFDHLFKEAEQKLKASPATKTGIDKLPVLFVCGNGGSVKTTTVLQSSLDPELLAGQVYQDTGIVSTQIANFWLARRTVIVETGWNAVADESVWHQICARFAPAGLAAAAPRTVVLCVSLEDFLQAGAGEQLTATARFWNQRLSALSRILGVRLPVYVLFTKSDRLAFFNEYFGNFSNEEAQEVLGATIPLAPQQSHEVYAEREAARVTYAHDELVGSLSAHRPEVLWREHDMMRSPLAYEFPREFRKLRQPIVSFLVELCRPSQLQVAPFLRGFYLTGFRTVNVVDAPAASAAAVSRQSFQAEREATGFFKVGQPSAAQAPPPPVGQMRKVPQWMFLTRLFQNVLLGDQAALGASASSVKTSFGRRLVLAIAGVLSLILLLGFLVSGIGNRQVLDDVMASARGASTISGAAPGELPPTESLQKLDALRQRLETLGKWRREGPPHRLRWFLYNGDNVYQEGRRIYFDRFAKLLLDYTQGVMVKNAVALPPAPSPTDDYDPPYRNLKAYLITTSNPEKSTREFLTPELMRAWRQNRDVDANRAALAENQFAFYASELPNGNPLSSAQDTLAVSRARNYLNQFSGVKRLYQAVLAEAAKKAPTVNFNRQYPGTAETVVNNRDVSGAFTKAGWDFMQDALAHPERFFAAELWVLGKSPGEAMDAAKLSAEMRKMYLDDFLNQWRSYIKTTSVQRYANLKDAAKKLQVLSSNQSPLLLSLLTASQNLPTADQTVATAFKPVLTVVPPGDARALISDKNKDYVTALVKLQAAVEAVAASGGGANDPNVGATLAAANEAKLLTRVLAQNFGFDPEANLNAVVQKILEDPITNAENLLRGLAPAELNGKGKTLCSQYRDLMSKAPFNPSGRQQATLEEFHGFFQPGTGALWQFYESSLKPMLTKQGSQYAPPPTAPASPSLTPGFIASFNRLAAVSEAVYPSGGVARFAYAVTSSPLEGLRSLTLVADGQTARFPFGKPTTNKLVWPGQPPSAQLQGDLGTNVTLLPGSQGVWAVFDLFGQAERWITTGSAHSVEWTIRTGIQAMTLPNGKPLIVHFDLDMPVPLFKRGYLSSLGCVADVAK